MKISYEQVQAFVAVADTGSFSAAAKLVNKHRTTLGQVISNLELEINMTLFDRSGRYPTLTDHGKSLYQQAKALSTASSAFEQLCLYQETGIETELRIYYSEQIPETFIANIMTRFRKRFRDVRLNWLQAPNSEILSQLNENKADIALVIRPNGDVITSIDFTHLVSMSYSVCASPSFIHKFRPTNLDSLKHLHQLTLVDYDHCDIAKSICPSNHLQKFTTLNVLLQTLVSGEGWAILPTHSVKGHLENNRLNIIPIQEVASDLTFPVIIWQTAKIMGPAGSYLLELMKNSAYLFD